MGTHIPVMLQESLSIFRDQKLSFFFDGTIGAGNFAQALLRAHPEVERYFGCDRDNSALELAKVNLKAFSRKVELVHANFCDVEKILQERGINKVNGFFLI